MVRKRSHKRCYKIESDESDSDDFYEEDSLKESPKKYSLRQRKGASLAEDPDLIPHAQPEEIHESETPQNPDVQTPKPSKSMPETLPANTPSPVTLQELKFEPEASATQNADGLIDFEDVIRADILVNTNKIDFEDMIDQNAINKQPVEHQQQQQKPIEEPSEKKLKLKKYGDAPKKRGRKPKKQTDEDCSSIDQFDNTGLPINSVLGVSESLYELAERYMQADPDGQMVQNDGGSPFLLTEADAASEPIEIF